MWCVWGPNPYTAEGGEKMGDIVPQFKAAAVQAASVYLDREKSLEKTVARL